MGKWHKEWRLGGLVAGLLLAAASMAAAEQVMVANLTTEPRTIDPAINNATDGSTVIFNLFEGLTRMNPESRPEPGCAERWDVSDEGKTYVFHLRDGLKWADGSPLVAEDFRYGMLRVLAAETGSSYAYHAYCIKNGKAYYEGKASRDQVGITTVDDKTLKIELEYPVPYFLDLLAWHLLLPLKAEIVEKNPQGWAADPATVLCNGPFRLAEWKHNSEMTLEKNPNYWDAANVKLDKVRLVMINDGNTALAAFKAGKLDYFKSIIPSVLIPELVAKGEAQILPNMGPYFYCCNVTRKPMDDVRVRKALALAIDREALVSVVTKGGQQPAVGFIPFGMPGTAEGKDFRAEGKDFLPKNADVEQAKKLLAEAGYPDGKDFPSITFVYNTNELHKQVAEAVQAMWKANLGITVNLTNQEWKVFINTRIQGDYDIARHGYFSDFNDLGNLFDLWVTKGPNNDAKYSNPEYDRIVLEAGREQDPAKRAALYHQAEEILMTDLPVIPIYYYTTPYMLNPAVKNLFICPLGWDFFRTASIEQ